MARNKLIRLYTRLSGAFTSSELIAREIALEESSNSLVAKKTDNTILRFGTGGSFTPQPYQASPTLTTLRDSLVSAGVMLAQPTYSVSGVISGTSPVGVSLSLVGAATYNITSGAGGIFSFTGIPDGSYTLTPTNAGNYYTPGNRSVTVSGANVTGQNFVSAAGQASAETSSTHVLVQGNGVLRAVSKSLRTQDAATFAAHNNNSYGMCYLNGRYFVPIWQNNSILVYDDSFVLRATIDTVSQFNVFNPYRVFTNGAKFAVVGGSTVRFFTWDNTTNTASALGGSQISLGVSMLDSVASEDKIYIASSFGGTPARNLSIVDFATEALTTHNVAVYANNMISHIGVFGDALYVGGGSTGAVIDRTTLAQRGSTISFGTGQVGRTSSSGGKFWLTMGSTVIRYISALDASNGIVSGLTPAPINLHGSVADGNFVYVADNANRLYVINSATNAQDGTPVTITGVSSPSYIKN